MALRVFISYAAREDQILALRLQTLAATRPGLEVYVPPASTRSRPTTPSGVDAAELMRCDLVLALITGPIPITMLNETDLATQLGKPVIPIVLLGRATVTGLQPVFYLDPFKPIDTQSNIIHYLETLNLAKSQYRSGIALVLIAVGLLALGKK